MYSFICDADDDLRFKEIYKPGVFGHCFTQNRKILSTK